MKGDGDEYLSPSKLFFVLFPCDFFWSPIIKFGPHTATATNKHKYKILQHMPHSHNIYGHIFYNSLFLVPFIGCFSRHRGFRSTGHHRHRRRRHIGGSVRPGRILRLWQRSLRLGERRRGRFWLAAQKWKYAKRRDGTDKRSHDWDSIRYDAVYLFFKQKLEWTMSGVEEYFTGDQQSIQIGQKNNSDNNFCHFRAVVNQHAWTKCGIW